MDVRIEQLTGRADLAPVLAGWHHAEWGHLYDPGVWDLDTAVRELEAMSRAGSADVTWIALDGDTLVGSVSLVGDDDLRGFEHLTPWLASMFVAPAARGRGVAGLLTDALLAGAAERGHADVHLFTSGQEGYWSARGWRVLERVDAEGHAATVMVRSTHPRGARRAVCSRWSTDPDTAGAYSHLRIGGTPAHRERLRGPILPGLWLAGEATAVEHPATMHGAWFSGERAAEQVLASGASDVLVIGAGIAGMVAARHLQEAECRVTVLESKPRPGGRIATDTSLGIPLPLGGAWLHGEIGHPMASLVSWVEEEWTIAGAAFVTGHGALSGLQLAALDAAYRQVHAGFEAAAPGVSVADAFASALTELDATGDLDPAVRAALVALVTVECESLFAAPMAEMPASGGYEPYELDGDDRLITSSLQGVIDLLADGLDIRCDERVATLTRDAASGRWSSDTGRTADAVIVTVPIGALRAGRPSFDPALPGDVLDAIDHLGAGPVAKVFATFDARWWPPVRPLRLAGDVELLVVTDMTDVTGVPTLCGFATGDAARRIERLDEDALCRLFDEHLASTGLRDWDATV